MTPIFDLLLGKRVKEDTACYLKQLAGAPIRTSRQTATRILGQLRSEPGPKVEFGDTLWDESVSLPVMEILKSHGLFTGGSGAGKTLASLLLIDALITLLPQTRNIGFGVVDVAKPDLFLGAIALLARRIDYLAQIDPEAAEELRRRILIVDFSSRDPISPYNILRSWPNAEPDFFASNRADLLLDLLPGGEKPSLAGYALLQKTILLLCECKAPVTLLSQLLHDGELRSSLLSRCHNRSIREYFARHFSEIPKTTVAALSRRLDALLVSAGVRLTLSGSTVPDFRCLQDDGAIVLVNCFGEYISSSVRRLLQCLVVSDIHSSVFRRQRRTSVLWFFDEAQALFSVQALRDHIDDLLRLSRSFGSHYLLITQNLTASISDPRLLRIVSTNVKWSLSFRGEPSDCAFLKPALPITGRKQQPQWDPFQEKRFYSIAEERSMELDSIAHLPDRVAYLWLRSRSPQAIKIKTRELAIPQGSDLVDVTNRIRRDPNIGNRLSLVDYERTIAERDRQWLVQPESDFGAALAEKFRKLRGAGA